MIINKERQRLKTKNWKNFSSGVKSPPLTSSQEYLSDEEFSSTVAVDIPSYCVICNSITCAPLMWRTNFPRRTKKFIVQDLPILLLLLLRDPLISHATDNRECCDHTANGKPGNQISHSWRFAGASKLCIASPTTPLVENKGLNSSHPRFRRRRSRHLGQPIWWATRGE